MGLAVVPASNARDFNFISGTNAKLDDPAGGSSEIYRSSATALRYEARACRAAPDSVLLDRVLNIPAAFSKWARTNQWNCSS